MDAPPCDIPVFRRPFSEGGAGSRALLYAAAVEYTGLSPQDLGPVDVGPRGKPFFPTLPRLHFSVTHSADWWLCAFSQAPVGLDLQVHRSHVPPPKLSRRFFHPLEDAFLAGNDYRGFFDLWCAKESWVKYTGHGFFDDPATFSVVSADRRFPAVDGAELRLLSFAPEYSLCVCAQSLGRVTMGDF